MATSVIRPQFDLATFNYGAIATQLKQSRDVVAKDKKKTTTYTSPSVAHLANAITDVRLMDTLEGSSTLEIGIVDPEFELYEFFDIDKDGKLDKIELQYPPGSPNWWRLTGLGMSTQAGQALSLNLTFMERPAVLLLHKRGPKKTSRAKVTRAQFLKSCVNDVKLHPLKFYSKELKVKQDIQGSKPVETRAGGGPMGTGKTWEDTKTPARKDETTRREQKDGGLRYGDDELTVKGVKASRDQVKAGERLLDVARTLNAPNDAVVALMMTAIAESNMGAARDNPRSDYGGILHGNTKTRFDASTAGDEEMAEACLRGGKGFNAPEGGLIGGVKAMNDKTAASKPYRSLGHLCYVNQGNRSNFGSDADAENFFGKHESEAAGWVTGAGGGFSGGSTYYRSQYNFQIGTEENPKERYWDGMTELAKEVRWRLFIDGRTIYFDSDMTLIRQKPVAIINRHDPAVLGFDATWDGERDLATEMQLELICEPFQFRAGEVFKLQGFGPLSNGSTALPEGLPGRWLIWEIDRSSGSYSSSFTLRQPERERMEPNADRLERADHGSTGGSLRDVDDAMTPQDIIDEIVLPIGKKHNAHTALGAELTSAGVVAANRGHGGAVGTTDHKGPPTSAWAVDMGQGTSQPTDDLDGLADELARKFGMTMHTTNHVYDFGSGDVTKDGVRYQLGWRVKDHFDHVHFGAKVVDPSKRKPRDAEPGTSSGGGGGPHGTGRP